MTDLEAWTALAGERATWKPPPNCSCVWKPLSGEFTVQLGCVVHGGNNGPVAGHAAWPPGWPNSAFPAGRGVEVAVAVADQVEPGPAIARMAAEAIATVIEGGDPAAVWGPGDLPCLVWLLNGLDQLVPKLRDAVRREQESRRETAAAEVPVEGDVEPCAMLVTHRVEVYFHRDGQLSLDRAVSSCPVHVDAYIARERHAGGKPYAAITSLEYAAADACGRVVDYRELLGEDKTDA